MKISMRKKVIALLLVVVSVSIVFVQVRPVNANQSSGPPHANYRDANGNCYPETDNRGPHVIAPGWRSGFPPIYTPGVLDNYGRQLNEGYFTGQDRMSQVCIPGNKIVWPTLPAYTDDLGTLKAWVYPQSVDKNNNSRDANGVTAAARAFVFFHAAALNKNIFCAPADSEACNNERRYALGSAFIILTMLPDELGGGPNNKPYVGKDGTTYPANNAFTGLVRAKDNFENWTKLVYEYDKANQINWNQAIADLPPHENSTSTGHGADASDVTIFWQPAAETDHFITFFDKPVTNPSRKPLYRINRSCANTVGRLALPPIGYDVRPTLYPFQPNIVKPGDEVTGNAKIQNFGTDESRDPTFLRVKSQSPGVSWVVPNTQVANPSSHPQIKQQGYDTGPAGSPIRCGGGTDNGPARDPCFYWKYGKLPNTGTTRKDEVSFKFKVKPDTPDGTKICFNSFAVRHTEFDEESQDGPQCVTVEVPKKPFVTGEDGNVHAGGRLADRPCGLSNGGTGTISGPLNTSGNGQGSYGTFAVSAGANINNFGSANSAGSNALTFGNINQTGRYGTICRNDLAAKYLATSTPPDSPQNLNPGTINSADLPNLNGLYIVNGDVTIGNSNSAVTIPPGKSTTLVVRGNVRIRAQVNLADSGLTRTTTPGFGVIAQRNVYIDPGVSNLDGIYWAGTDPARYPQDPSSPLYLANNAATKNSIGVIDTCRDTINNNAQAFSPLIANNPGACGNRLTLNGLLSARKMYFRRTAGDVATTGSAPAERILFDAQVFLKPPPGFGTTAARITEQGERPPLN